MVSWLIRCCATAMAAPSAAPAIPCRDSPHGENTSPAPAGRGNPSRATMPWPLPAGTAGPRFTWTMQAMWVADRLQLQVEHALDLQRTPGRPVRGRRTAWRGGRRVPGLHPGRCMYPACNSHALSAPAVLQVAEQLNGQAPPAWQLAMEVRISELGAALGPAATLHLARGVSLAMDWIATSALPG